MMMSKFEQLDWENIDLNDTNYFIQLFQAMGERKRGGINTWINEICSHQYKTYEVLLQMAQHFQQVVDDGWILDEIEYYDQMNDIDPTTWTNSNWRPYLKVWTPRLIVGKTGVNYRNFTYGNTESYKNCLLGIKLGLELLTKKPINNYCTYKKGYWGVSISRGGRTFQYMQEAVKDRYETEVTEQKERYDEKPIDLLGTKNPVMDFGNISQSVVIDQRYLKETISYEDDDGEKFVSDASIIGGGYKLQYLGNKSCKLKNIIARLKNKNEGTITYGYDDVEFGINFIDLKFTFSSENNFYEDTYVPTEQIPKPVYSNPVDEEEKEYVTIDLYYDVYIIPYLDFGVEGGFEYY